LGAERRRVAALSCPLRRESLATLSCSGKLLRKQELGEI
jgi:hypothetical protein